MPKSIKETAFEILHTLKSAGFETYCVGGCVRDSLLGKTPKDWDITTEATPDEIQEIFPDADFVGASFGVSIVKKNGFPMEVATFRIDEDYTDSRHPNKVTFTRSAVKDVARRDFTVNALLMDEDEHITDFVMGKLDLQDHLIRCVGNPNTRFHEDALRMLRAVRFCVLNDFHLEDSTKKSIFRNAYLIQNVSAERIANELSRMFTSGHVDVAFDLLMETNLSYFILPELLDLVNCEQDEKNHPEGDVAEHTKLLLKNLEKDCSLTLTLAVLLHDIGKPKTKEINKRGTICFYGHEHVGAKMTQEILSRLKFSNDVIKTVVSHVQNHMKFFAANQMKKSTLIRFLRTPNFSELLELHRLDCIASNGDLSSYNFVKEFFESHQEEIFQKPFIGGDDLIALGFNPSPAFKGILKRMEDLQLEGEFANKKEALNFLS
ncbi:CCA-adding enzyme [uncultured archaeon]|nr:CCA-adding enzyme [uncultured archaeon]